MHIFINNVPINYVREVFLFYFGIVFVVVVIWLWFYGCFCESSLSIVFFLIFSFDVSKFEILGTSANGNSTCFQGMSMMIIGRLVQETSPIIKMRKMSSANQFIFFSLHFFLIQYLLPLSTYQVDYNTRYSSTVLLVRTRRLVPVGPVSISTNTRSYIKQRHLGKLSCAKNKKKRKKNSTEKMNRLTHSSFRPQKLPKRPLTAPSTAGVIVNQPIWHMSS